jgi:hypothetical protein
VQARAPAGRGGLAALLDPSHANQSAVHFTTVTEEDALMTMATRITTAALAVLVPLVAGRPAPAPAEGRSVPVGLPRVGRLLRADK